MNTVTVQASRSYEVRIGSGLRFTLGAALKDRFPCEKVCIVSDSNVWPLYGAQIQQQLEECGFSVSNFVFPAGEESKNGATYLSLLNALARAELTRTDAIVALGGGVVGDLAGFAAATYLRGISFVQLPTTLLAAVDSSVGGKTAIDLDSGKNLAGAFCQPSLVLCDTDTLNTLPEAVFLDGCAEVIKYAVLYDPGLFDLLEGQGLAFHRQAVITRCIQWKRDVVARDEFDTGERMKLNLGHTVGHGIEAASGYRISHGNAVAMGMAAIARAFPCADTPRILRLLEKFGLPVHSPYPADEILPHIRSDKKRSADHVKLIIPEKIGFCRIQSTPISQLESILQAGL